MIAIVDCGTNLSSIQYALARLGKTSMVSADPKLITSASHVIIPGVNRADKAMQKLQFAQLQETLLQLRQPVLGICSGMQIMFSWSEEGDVFGLGIFPESVQKIRIEAGQTLPHMGWNQLHIEVDQHPIFLQIKTGAYVYFVHSYGVPQSEFTIASTQYGNRFSAVVAKNNFMGVQFHPERSGKTGAQLLKNFLEMR